MTDEAKELVVRLEALAATVEQVPVEFIQREKLASMASHAASLIRSLSERNEKLEGLLSDVLLDAERGAYIRAKCSYAYGDGYEQPYELTISWEWQQSKPHTSGWGAFQHDVDSWLSELREDGVDLALIRARAALERK